MDKIEKAIKIIEAIDLPEKDKKSNIKLLKGQTETVNGWTPEKWAEFIIWTDELTKEKTKKMKKQAEEPEEKRKAAAFWGKYRKENHNAKSN